MDGSWRSGASTKRKRFTASAPQNRPTVISRSRSGRIQSGNDRRCTDLLQLFVTEFAKMHGLPAKLHSVVWHCRARRSAPPGSARANRRESRVEHGAKPHHAEEPPQFDAVDRNVGRGAVARQGQRSWIGTIEGNRKLPECRERRRSRRLDDLADPDDRSRSRCRLADDCREQLRGHGSDAIGSLTVRWSADQSCERLARGSNRRRAAGACPCTRQTTPSRPMASAFPRRARKRGL